MSPATKKAKVMTAGSHDWRACPLATVMMASMSQRAAIRNQMLERRIAGRIEHFQESCSRQTAHLTPKICCSIAATPVNFFLAPNTATEKCSKLVSRCCGPEGWDGATKLTRGSSK